MAVIHPGEYGVEVESGLSCIRLCKHCKLVSNRGTVHFARTQTVGMELNGNARHVTEFKGFGNTSVVLYTQSWNGAPDLMKFNLAEALKTVHA